MSKPSIQETVRHFDGVWPSLSDSSQVIIWLSNIRQFLAMSAMGSDPEARVCTYSEFMAEAERQKAA